MKILFSLISYKTVWECTAAMQIVFHKSSRGLFKSMSYHQVISNNSLTFDTPAITNSFHKYFITNCQILM